MRCVTRNGDVTKTGNGEWGMGNGEWGMGNGEWGKGNGKLKMGNKKNLKIGKNMKYLYFINK